MSLPNRILILICACLSVTPIEPANAEPLEPGERCKDVFDLSLRDPVESGRWIGGVAIKGAHRAADDLSAFLRFVSGDRQPVADKRASQEGCDREEELGILVAEHVTLLIAGLAVGQLVGSAQIAWSRRKRATPQL